jgi:hypothetical protein
MALWLFLGGFLAVVVAIICLVVYIRRRIRRFRSSLPDTRLLDGLIGAMGRGELDFEMEESQRSLNGCDRFLLPQILQDFPDFDPDQAKNLCKDYLRDRYRGKSAFTVYDVVYAQYLRSGIQKTIIMQAAASYMNGGKKKQIRCEVDYAYHVDTASETIAANCPNCGAALGYGITVCPYCDSRVANVMGNAWKFTNLREN